MAHPITSSKPSPTYWTEKFDHQYPDARLLLLAKIVELH